MDQSLPSQPEAADAANPPWEGSWMAAAGPGAPGGVTTALVVVMVVIFLLGFILDFIEITFVGLVAQRRRPTFVIIIVL